MAAKLTVWWKRSNGEGVECPVSSPEEAVKLLERLANEDLANPKITWNMGGLLGTDGDEWYSEALETEGMNIDEYAEWLKEKKPTPPAIAAPANDDNNIPQHVIETLAEIREIGTYNMFAKLDVLSLAYELNEEAGAWLDDNLGRYMEALNAMGNYVTAQKETGVTAPAAEAPAPAATMLKDFDDAQTEAVAEQHEPLIDTRGKSYNPPSDDASETTPEAVDGFERPCEHCGGSGHITMHGLYIVTCDECDGTGIHTEPELTELDALRAENEALKQQLAAARAALEAIVNIDRRTLALSLSENYAFGYNMALSRAQVIAQEALNK